MWLLTKEESIYLIYLGGSGGFNLFVQFDQYFSIGLKPPTRYGLPSINFQVRYVSFREIMCIPNPDDPSMAYLPSIYHNNQM